MKDIMLRGLAIGILVLFLGVIGIATFSRNMSTAVAQATIHVDDDNTAGPWDGTITNPYQHIQDGVNAASNGDTVYVLDGTYNENVVLNKSIMLKGDTPKPVIDGMAGVGIDVHTNDVTIDGFNITNSMYGIYSNASGFTVVNNFFSHDTVGLYWYVFEWEITGDHTIYDATVLNNQFYLNISNNNAVSASIRLNYNYSSGYDVSIGDVSICSNAIHMDGTDAAGIYVYWGVDQLFGGSVSVGILNMSDNTIHGGEYGILFSGGLAELQDVQASVGDVVVNNNVMVNQRDSGIETDYYVVEYLYGNTTVTLGDFIVRGNTITSYYGASGVTLGQIGYWYMFYDYANLEFGNVYIEDNEIYAGDDGIGIYALKAGYELHENSSFTMGHILVRHNTINISSSANGIYADFDYFGSEMYGNASCTIGNIDFSGNEINSGGAGIFPCYLKHFGTGMYSSTTFTVGNIEFNDNVINCDDYGIRVHEVHGFGCVMEDTSSFTMGNIDFSGNMINSTYDGIYFHQIYDVADDMVDNSSFKMGNFSVNDNVIMSDDDGIHLDYLEPFGLNLYDNASFTMDTIEFSHNTISYSDAAMNFTDLEDATIRNNMIQNCSYGIYLLNSTNNLIYHNNFVNNTVQTHVTFSYTNTWDNDYPSGGNYWSSFIDVDQNSGPSQNITGSDGIWDHPYVINADNQDRYPFTGIWKWDTEPPSISDVTQNPEAPDDGETVTVTAVVTDGESDVYNVTLSFSTDGGTTWKNITMTKMIEDTWQGEILGHPVGTSVQFKIIAYDSAGNPAVEDRAGEYYVYTVIPEFSTFTSMLLSIIGLTAAVVVYKRRQLKY